MTASAARAQGDARRGTFLVGRELTIDLVVDAMLTGGGAVLCGDPGVGRAAVLGAAAARASEAGMTLVRLDADPSDPTPFAALIWALPEDPPLRVDAESLAAVADALLAGARPGPVVVMIEGIEGLDAPSAAVVQHLVSSGAAHLLASTGLREEHAPGGAGPWWWDAAVRVELQPLHRTDADRLAEVLVGGPLDAASREHLWAAARGRPGWLSAIVTATQETGAWERQAGLWSLRDAADTEADVELLTRLDALPPDVCEVLEVLSLAEAVPIDDAEAIGGPAPLAEAERRGLVRTDDVGGGRLWCAVANRIVGSALRDAMGRGAERERCERLAEVLGASASTEPATALARALALVGAGRAETDAAASDLDAVHDGAHAAQVLSRWPECADLARRVWRARGDASALTLLTACLGVLSDHESIRALSVELGEAHADPHVRAHHATTIAISQFHSDDAVGAFATTARARATCPPEDRGFLDVFESRLRSFAGDQDRALDLAGPMCHDVDAERRVDALTVVASVAGIRGDTAAAISGFEEAFALATSLPEAPLALAGTPYLFRLSALAEAGRLRDAIAEAEAVEPAAARTGDQTSHGWLALHLGRCLLSAGRPRTAARWFGQAVNDLRPLHRPGWLAHPAAGLVAAHAAAGDLGAARAARTAWSEIPTHSLALFRPEELRFVAWLDAAEGDLGAAADAATAAAAAARDAGSLSYEVAAHHDLARWGRGGGRQLAAEALAAAATRSDSPVVAAHAAQAAALASGQTDELAAVALRYAALGHIVDAIETWAELARRGGPDRERAMARRRVEELRGGSEGLTTPMLGEVDDRPLLTDREREIADAVLDGATRQDAADRLVVSVRTIDSHLQRIYRKLGVRGRAGLIEVLGPVEPDR